jgi:hypothetical protein
VNKPKNEKPEFNTRKILEIAIAIDRKQGFVKSGYGYTVTNDPDTGEYLESENQYVIEDNKTLIHKHLKDEKKVRITAGDKEQAGEMIEHFKAIALKKLSGKTNDFQNSVLLYIDAEKVDRLGVAIFASLPSVYVRDIKAQEFREETEESDYVGTYRKRGNFTIEVKQTRSFPTGNLMICVEGGKNIVKFFADIPVEVGKVLNIAGFVKDQEVSKYSGLKETMLNRVKVIS